MSTKEDRAAARLKAPWVTDALRRADNPQAARAATEAFVSYLAARGGWFAVTEPAVQEFMKRFDASSWIQQLIESDSGPDVKGFFLQEAARAYVLQVLAEARSSGAQAVDPISPGRETREILEAKRQLTELSNLFDDSKKLRTAVCDARTRNLVRTLLEWGLRRSRGHERSALRMFGNFIDRAWLGVPRRDRDRVIATIGREILFENKTPKQVEDLLKSDRRRLARAEAERELVSPPARAEELANLFGGRG